MKRKPQFIASVNYQRHPIPFETLFNHNQKLFIPQHILYLSYKNTEITVVIGTICHNFTVSTNIEINVLAKPDNNEYNKWGDSGIFTDTILVHTIPYHTIRYHAIPYHNIP